MPIHVASYFEKKKYFQVLMILSTELINRKRTDHLIKNLHYVDQKLHNKYDYGTLRLTLILIFIVGFFIFCRETRIRVDSMFTISSIKSLCKIYYVYMLSYVSYIFIFKFVAMCYIIHQRFNSINQILTDFSKKEAANV